MRVNSSDRTIKKVQEIYLEMWSCVNVAFNKKGNIFVVVGFN
jgi:hypothetical protein